MRGQTRPRKTALPKTDPQINGRHTMPKRSDAQERAVFDLHRALSELEFDLHDAVEWQRHVPRQWSDLHMRGTPPKTKVTVRIDSDIIKYLKSLGPGYQERMNNVLRAWVAAKAAKMIRDEVRITREREEEAHRNGAVTFIDENGDLQYR